MYGNNLNNGSINNTYRATKNLNTAIDSPQFNINDTHDVNIQNVNNNNFARDNNYINDLGNSDVASYSNNFDNSSEINNNLDNVIIDNNSNDNTFINSNVSNEVNDNIYNSTTSDSVSISDNNEKVTYTPTKKVNNKKKVTVTVTPELKILVMIVGILLIFIFLMPNLYDFIEKIKLLIFYR